MSINDYQWRSWNWPARNAYNKALVVKRSPKLEDIILTSPFYSYLYAKDVIKRRWIEAEDIIMPDSFIVWLYSREVIKGKLPEKMHNMMILHGIKDPDDSSVKNYFEYISSQL